MADEKLNQDFEKVLKETAHDKADDILGKLKTLQDSVNALVTDDPKKTSVETELSRIKGMIAGEADLEKRKLMIDGFAARLSELSQTVQVKPAEGSEVAPTYERTRNYKSGHSKVRGVKPGFEDMPSIEAVKSRTLTGQVDIDGFGMEWRKSSWYKRFIEAAAVLRFCAPLMDDDTKAWIAEIQPAIYVFAGLKDLPKNKWKNEIWKFIAVDRKVNAPMIYAPGGALNFLLAFDRLLDVQPEVKAYALAGNVADLNKLNIAWIRMEKGTGKTRAEKAKERRATVRTYAEVVGSVPAPVVLPVDGAPVPAPSPDPNPVVPPAPTPAPPAPTPVPAPDPNPVPPAPVPVPPAPAPAPGPAPDVNNTYNPTMDTSPEKLKFGPNKAFLDQYMMDESEFSKFVKAMKIFKDDDISVNGQKPIVEIDPSNVPENEATIPTPELDRWLTDLGKSDVDYWNQFGVNWNDVSSLGNGGNMAKVQENFGTDDPKRSVIMLFDRIEEFKDMYRYYFFDTQRPIAMKLQNLEYLAGMRIYQYATKMNRTFLAESGRFGAAYYFSGLLLGGKNKLPLTEKADTVPNALWQDLTDPGRSNVLRTFKGMAEVIAGSTSKEADNAKKWLDDNRTELDRLPN